jgi:ribosome biogenesis GTPase
VKHFDEEEQFHARDRKQFRKERKHAQQTDRSKFKKTDQFSSEETTSTDHLSEGRILAISGEGSLVDSQEKLYLCSLKGLLKKEKNLSKNIVAVGDRVFFEITAEKEGAIVSIAPRTSFLSRVDISGRKEQLIAVNIDLAIISVSLVEPPLKPSLIDRYLIAAAKGNLRPVIVINKIDLLPSASEEEKELYANFLSAYEPLGYPILSVSAETGVGLDSLRAILHNQTSVFSGQSGVGKSSLLNACFGLMLKTGELTQKTAKGAHTTTRAELLPLPGGGYCVDTPGIRSFALWNLEKQDVLEHFTEFTSFKKKCKYPDCSHIVEPECAVCKAVEKGKIAELRYTSYLTLIEEVTNKQGKTTWG